MSLATIILEQLEVARRIIEDGHEVVPAWRIMTPEGAFLIFTRFDTDKPEQREYAIVLISRFMAWKMATSFVYTVKTWIGPEQRRVVGDETFLVIGVSHQERLAALLDRRRALIAGSSAQPPRAERGKQTRPRHHVGGGLAGAGDPDGEAQAAVHRRRWRWRGVYDRLVEMGHGDIVRSVNFGSQPIEPEPRDKAGLRAVRINRRVEMWMKSKEWLEEPAVRRADP